MTARSGGGGRGSGRMRGDSAEEKRHAKIRQQLNEKYGGNWAFNTRTYRWEDPETEKKLDAAQAQKWSEYLSLVEQEKQAKRDYWDAKWNRGPLGAIQDKLDDLKGQIQNFSFDINYDEWELPTPQELLDDIGEFYEGSDVDTFLEDTKDLGDLMLDTVITVATGEDHGKVKELKEEGQKTQEAYQDLADDFQTGLDNIQDVTTDTITTTNEVTTQIGTEVAEQINRALGTDETQGGAVTEETRGGDVVRDEDLLQLGKKKSDLKAAKKKGKKGLRIDYGVNIPGVGKSGIAA